MTELTAHPAPASVETLPWQQVRHVVAYLDQANGQSAHEIAMRLLKVSEEAGEAAQAYIGLMGQNPRKGVTHTTGDVAVELCDVILAAMVALHAFEADPGELLHDIANHRTVRLTAHR